MGNTPLSSSTDAAPDPDTEENYLVTPTSGAWAQWRNVVREAATPTFDSRSMMYTSVAAQGMGEGEGEGEEIDDVEENQKRGNEMNSTSKQFVEVHVASGVVGPVVITTVDVPVSAEKTLTTDFGFEAPPPQTPTVTLWIKGKNKDQITSTKLELDVARARIIVKPLFPGVSVSDVEVHLMISGSSLDLVLRCTTTVAVRHANLHRFDVTCASLDVTRSYVRTLVVKGTRELTQTLAVHGLETRSMSTRDILNVDAHGVSLQGSASFVNCGLAVLNFKNPVEIDGRSSDFVVMGRTPASRSSRAKAKTTPAKSKQNHKDEDEDEEDEDVEGQTPTVLFTREGVHSTSKTRVVINF